MLYPCVVFLLHRDFPKALLLQRLQKRHRRQEISSEQTFLFVFQEFASYLLKYKNISNLVARKFHFQKYMKFFNLGARKFHILKYKKFFQGRFFFSSLGLKVLQSFTLNKNKEYMKSIRHL